MKKLIFTFVIISALFLLVACNDNDETQTLTPSTNETGTTEEVPENAVRITISINDGEQFINEQQVEIEQGENLLDILDNTFFIETNEADEITSIERMQVDVEDNTTWKMYVNDELTDIPVKDYQVNGGEKIVFDLQ